MKDIFKCITLRECNLADGYNFKMYFIFKMLQTTVQLLL